MSTADIEHLRRIVYEQFTPFITTVSLGKPTQKGYENVKEQALRLQESTVEKVLELLKNIK